MHSVLLLALLTQAPSAAPSKGGVKIIKSDRSKVIAAKTQAQLDAEARAEDQRLRCAEDPSACGTTKPESKELSAKEDALRRKEAELAAREEAVKKKEEEEKEQKEKQAQQRKQVEKQVRQLEQNMQGLNGALAGEE
jgi:Skp family chaperone for outer membrane proteins